MVDTAGSGSLPRCADFVIVGGGIVGLTLALELRKRQPTASIVVLEKERSCGQHASGRNSGVLHAGFYYSADSLKARFTRDGNAAMRRWCKARKLALRPCGKLVVANNEAEHAGLRELQERGRRNGVKLETLSEAEVRDIEPHVRTCGWALFAPSTATVDPGEVMAELAREARSQRIVVCTNTAWQGRRGRLTRTRRGDIEAGYLVNTAGLQADKIAHAHGFGKQYCIIPFKGLYLYGNSNTPSLSTLVYPVPNMEMPFLGLHLTVTVDGQLKIGPTALPAFWRENYGGFDRHFFAGFNPRELGQIVLRELSLLLRNRSFRRHAIVESRKIFRHVLVAEAGRMVDGLRLADFTKWGRPGIRAQLLDRRSGELVTDFHVEADEHSLHVLNAVSPAFTCSLPFAVHLADSIEQRRGC